VANELDAEYYQAHKDEDEEWGEPERAPSSERRRLVSMVSVRFSPEEVAAVRAAAAVQGESVSNFIRQASLERSGVRAVGGRTYEAGGIVYATTGTGTALPPATVVIQGAFQGGFVLRRGDVAV